MATVKYINHRWNYCGDINIRNGGYYWREPAGTRADYGKADYVEIVHVTPCGDAGGPLELFWLDAGSVYLGNDSHIASALRCCGIEPSRATRAEIVQSIVAYMGFDSDWTGKAIVQIGAHCDQDIGHGWNPESPDSILRGNASLRRYIRREYLNN